MDEQGSPESGRSKNSAKSEDPVGALAGVRVLDIGIILQGPQAGQMLSDLGADVIKIEEPGVGDLARYLPIRYPDDMRAPWFIAANRGKRSLTLDLRTEQGREVFLSLVGDADVVLSNFVPGTMERWSLGWDDLRAVNPRIIVATASAYGALGPGAHRKGADLGGQAQGGLVSSMADRAGGAQPVPVTMADHIGSQNLTVAILAALIARERTGEGQHVQASLLGGQVFAQAPEMTASLLAGEQIRAVGSEHPLLRAYYGVFPTADGHIALVGVPGPEKRAEFWTAVGRPEHGQNERLCEMFLSTEAHREVFEILDDVFPERSTAEWVSLFEELDIRYAPVQSHAEVAIDPCAWANGYLQTVDHPEWGEVTQIGSPIQMSGTPTVPGAIAPELGQHTEEVLLESGWTWDDIGRLQEGGVI